MAREAQAAVATADERENRISHRGRKSRRGFRRWPPRMSDDAGGGGVTPIQMAEKQALDKADPASEKSGGKRLANSGSFEPADGAVVRSQLPFKDGADLGTDQTNAGPAASRNEGQVTGETDNVGGGIEPAVDPELVQLLQGLNATIEAAHRVLYAAANTLANQASDVERATLPPPPTTRKPTRQRHGRTAVVSVASILALLGWLGWHLHENPSMLRDGMLPLKSADELEERGDPTLAAVIPPAAEGIAATVERAKEAAPASLPHRLRGRAGRPIPLGTTLPQLGRDAEASLMVQGIPERAKLSAGQRVGRDSWILSAEQVPGVALLVPDDFAPSQVALEVMVVTSDGRIPEAHSIVAAVEPAEARLAQVEQAAHGSSAPAPSEPASATTEKPGTAMRSIAAPPRPSASASDAQAAVDPRNESPVPEATTPNQEPDLHQPLENRKAMPWDGDAAARFILAHALRQVGVSGVRQDNTQPTVLYERTWARAADLRPAADRPLEMAASSGAASAGAAPAGASATSERPSPETALSRGAPSANPDETQTGPAGNETGNSVAPTHTAKVSTHVNVRAGPDNDAAVITVAPAGSRVEVIKCNRWCEVTFAGKRGWIHNRFIAGTNAMAARAGSGVSGSWWARIRSIFRP